MLRLFGGNKRDNSEEIAEKNSAPKVDYRDFVDFYNGLLNQLKDIRDRDSVDLRLSREAKLELNKTIQKISAVINSGCLSTRILQRRINEITELIRNNSIAWLTNLPIKKS